MLFQSRKVDQVETVADPIERPAVDQEYLSDLRYKFFVAGESLDDEILWIGTGLANYARASQFRFVKNGKSTARVVSIRSSPASNVVEFNRYQLLIR